MNISTLFSRANFMPNHTPVFKRGNIPSNISTLVGGLSTEPHTGTHQLIQGPNIHLRMKGENCIYSGGRFSDSATFQNIYAEYTSDSTAEDPVVRISGTAESGKFDFICHIRDIDPSNASYAELSALYGYLCHSGAYQTKFGSQAIGVLPCGMECGDILQKQDFIRGLNNFAASSTQSNFGPKFGPAIYAHAKELLELYQGFAQNK
jgi:hypothetical protein